jgi:hypothetical protein
MENTTAIDVTLDASASRSRDAYEQLLPQMAALSEDALSHINVDIPAAVTMALGAWPEVHAFHDKVIGQLPRFDMAAFDKLDVYARAAGHAHALYMAASTPTESIPQIAEEAVAVRELLFSDATALAKRGLLDGARLKELKGPVGYRNTAWDLMTLSAMMRERWPSLEGRTPTQLADLSKAEALADRLVEAVGAREQGPAVAVAAAAQRQRAYTLFVNVYEQARRAIGFIRWAEGDVDDILPSLYAGRNAGARKKGEAAGDATSPDVVKAPSGDGPTTVMAPLRPGALASAEAARSQETAQTTKVPVGFPGNDPFNR